jgi:hypothetical protein
LKSWFQKIFGRFPFLGPLLFCRKKDWKAAFTESYPNVLCSMAPLLIAWLMTFLFDLPEAMKNPTYIFKNGELMMAALSTIAPLFYLTQTFYPSEDSPDKTLIPGARWFLVLLFLFVLVSAAMYPLFQIANQADVSLLLKPKPAMILGVSTGMYLASIALVFLALCYRSFVSDGNADLFRQSDDNARVNWEESNKPWRT